MRSAWCSCRQVLHGFFYGITIPLLWAMIADVADYSEWRNNRRATAIIFSAMSCGLKIGLSIGGALVAGSARPLRLPGGASATVAGGHQRHQSRHQHLRSIPFLIGVALLFSYEIDKRMESRIEQDLGQRRAATV